MPISETKIQTVPVTIDDFTRAETDRAFGGEIKLNNSLGKFAHRRELIALNDQVVPRVNRDTLYSTAVFDLDAGDVTIVLPDAGKRFMTMIVIDEDHYVHNVYYGAGSYKLAKDKIGTRYVMAALRMLVDPASLDDMKAVHALQDAIKVDQKSLGSFEVPNWDQAGLTRIREALFALNSSLPDLRRAFGSRDEVDPIRHLIGTATAWGGNPDKDAIYLNITPTRNDGKTIYQINVTAGVPVDGFWSITVYNKEGYLEPNKLNVYSLNNISAKKDGNGSVAVQFGGCAGNTPNCLPIMAGWNYLVRLYRPRPEILNGSWRFPDAQPSEGIRSAA